MNTDRIQKKILLHAPMARVWRALSDSSEFGTWFGVKFESPFKPGATMKGVLVGTAVDPEVAAAQSAYKGISFELTIEKIEPEKLFSFRWHPGGHDPKIDYSSEPMTLVEFRLEEMADGVMLTVTESGFDKLPHERRAQAFNGNESGWTMMVQVIGKYLAQER